MNEPPPQSPARKALTILGSVSAIVVILIAVVIGKVVGRQGAKALFNRDSTSVPAHFSEAQWQRRTLQDISLQAPFDFDVGPDVSARIPQAVRDAIEYFQIFQNRGGGTFGVTISRFAYKPHVEVSLDGSVQGAMTQAATAAGDSDPQYSSTTTTISGLEARRASYQGNVSGRTMQIEAAFIRRGQKLWQVQVLFLSPSSAGDAYRILESITITP